MNRIRNNIICGIILLLAGIAFYMLDQYSFSTYDDCHYCFIVKPTAENYLSMVDDDYHPQPIETFNDVLESQKNFYVNSNGRFLVHVVAQTCCSFMTRSQFAIINSLVFIVFLYLFTLSVTTKTSPSLQEKDRMEPNNHFTCCGGIKWHFLIISLTAIWFLLATKDAVFWGNIANVTNYHFVAVAVMGLILSILSPHPNSKSSSLKGLAKLGLVYLSALIVASLQESFTIGLAVALVVYYSTNRQLLKESFHRALIVGFAIGAAFCIFAPGNFNRVADYREFSFSFLFYLLLTPSFVLLAISLLYGAIKKREETINFLKDNHIWFTTIIVSIVFNFFIAFTNRPQITVINIFSLILLLRLWLPKLSTLITPPSSLISSLLYPLSSLLLITITFIPVYQMRKQMHTAFNAMLDDARHTENGIVVAKDYEHLAYVVENNPLMKYYVSSFMFVGNDLCKRQFSLWLTKGRNNNLIRTYLPMKPIEIEAFCTEKNKVGKNVFLLPDDYYVVISDTLKPCSDVTLHVKTADFSSLISNSSETVLSSSEHVQVGTKHYYLFAHKPKITTILE